MIGAFEQHNPKNGMNEKVVLNCIPPGIVNFQRFKIEKSRFSITIIGNSHKNFFFSDKSFLENHQKQLTKCISFSLFEMVEKELQGVDSLLSPD